MSRFFLSIDLSNSDQIVSFVRVMKSLDLNGFVSSAYTISSVGTALPSGTCINASSSITSGACMAVWNRLSVRSGVTLFHATLLSLLCHPWYSSLQILLSIQVFIPLYQSLFESHECSPSSRVSFNAPPLTFTDDAEVVLRNFLNQHFSYPSQINHCFLIWSLFLFLFLALCRNTTTRAWNWGFTKGLILVSLDSTSQMLSCI